jgi:homoserine dehydrogenase
VTAAPLRIAVLGAGTVGGQVVRGLVEHAGAAASDEGRPLELTGIAVRDVEGARARGLPSHLLTDAPAHLVADPDTDVIVELMGGDEPARTLVGAALQAGKAVVTANKHLLAHHGAALEAISRASGAPLRFEASVGGGIPVLSPLAGDLAANRISAVRGIVNGTTNYILSAMAAGDGTYEAVLRDAQERGYAEADPSGDVEGRDAINKLVVLARLAFDAWLDPDTIADRPASVRGQGGPGITGVTALDLEGARALGLTLRLVAVASRGDGANPSRTIRAAVMPIAVPSDGGLGGTGGVRNRIEVTGEPVGTVGFDGPGAGGEATSSAVLGDLLALARGAGSTWAGRPVAADSRSSTTTAADPGGASARWFAFLPGVRAGHVVDDLAEAAADTGTGVAIRTGWLPLDQLRSRIVDAAPATLDAQIYAIDD